ncbi:MAG TPA: DNA polymerase [Candidatus Saccharimonadales bacterium]|jgi:hypothetical protein|nr:DNA polymerase [Candidatus Saccharimonadales bacterium]
MPRIYQPKTFADGTANPRFKPRPNRNPTSSGHALNKFERGQFVAWDGEGVTDKSGEHKYIMLCTSLGGVASLINPRGLSTADCLDQILHVGALNKRAIHVAFGASYDVNMMLADCTRAEVQAVWEGHWTLICDGEYAVQYRARKSFSVRRGKPQYKNIDGKLTRVDLPNGVVLWDVFGFFQSTFVDACEKYLGKDYPELQFIREQKQRRQQFSVKELAEIERYCLLECRTLEALMLKLREYLEVAELPIRRWDGAGACAAALLQREKILDHKRECMAAVNDAAQHAYAGGRMELCRYGHAPNTPIYHYDINSAYPAAMCKLPCLQSGEFIRGQNNYQSGLPFSLYRVRFNFGDCAMYPFFWRADNCSIFYPQEGEGWYWAPEVEVAREALAAGVLTGELTILDSYHFVTRNTVSPFDFLPRLYEQRKQWKAEGIGAEKVIKLAINSLYGKTAQQAGGERTGGPPRYHQLEWAGYITSYTRAMLYRAMLPALKDRNIIMCATDGIYSLQPLALPLGDQLGQWEYKQHDGITVVQSGVYWTYQNGKEPAAFCRGFDRGSLHIDGIVKQWKRRQTTYDASLTRFVTMGSALAGRASFKKWRQWRTVPRLLSLTTEYTKRFDELGPEEWTREIGPHCQLVYTHAAIPGSQVVGQTMSAKYPLKWKEENDDIETELDGAPIMMIEQEAYDATI